MPWDAGLTSFDHLSADFQRDIESFNFTGGRAQTIKDLYKQAPVLFTIIRNDGQRCCRCPCKCLSSFVCCSCCQDGVEIYAGPTPEDPEVKGNIGRPYNLDRSRMIGSVTQPIFGGCCHPELHLREGNATEEAIPFGKIIRISYPS